MKHFARAAAVFLVMLLPAVVHAQPQTKVRLAVGGKSAFYYLPLTVTERLGYFKDEGLNVEISDVTGGSRALQALMGGSADVVTGAFDHTIQMQAKKQPIQAVVQLGRFPGIVLGIVTAKAGDYKTAADLKGMRIGITAPGSSTHFMVLHMMTQAGLKADDASFVAVGTGEMAAAAVQQGQIDALVNVDPVITLLQSQNAIKIAVDTRTLAGTLDAFGGPYPGAVLYLKPSYAASSSRTVQGLTNAFVHGLRWISGHTASEIAKVMPPAYALGNPALYVESIRSSIPMYSPDGHFNPAGADTALKVLSEFDTTVRDANINVAATYTTTFLNRVRDR